MNTTRTADLTGGWSIEYFHGAATFEGRSVEGLHVLRVFGDMTRPDALREAINHFRRTRLMTQGPTLLHSPLGPIAQWDFTMEPHSFVAYDTRGGACLYCGMTAEHAYHAGHAPSQLTRARIPTPLRAPIIARIDDLVSAKAWIRGLLAAGLDFHFEDSPETVVNDSGRVFTDEECPTLRAQVEHLYSFEWDDYECPIGYMLAVHKLMDARNPDTLARLIRSNVAKGMAPDVAESRAFKVATCRAYDPERDADAAHVTAAWAAIPNLKG